MTMDNGYPTEAEIDAFLSARGLELIPEYDENFIPEFKQTIWGILNALDWVMALGVWCPSPTTYKIRGGKYLWKGEVKTYTPGDAIDPTDNDTTYIWMKPDNTIGYDIDGNGWPVTEHIKLAEIDVDSDGVITAVRDLRSQAFLQYIGALSGGHTFLLTATLSGGNTAQIHNASAPFKYRILDAWSIAKSADGGTWKLTDGANDITDIVAVTATDKTIDRAGTIDDAYYEIAASGSLSVVGDGANADCVVNILCVKA